MFLANTKFPENDNRRIFSIIIINNFNYTTGITGKNTGGTE